MSNNSEASPHSVEQKTSRYGGYNHIVDYILGITFEIWEEGDTEAVLDYYREDIDVFSLEGITHGAARMVEQTQATLRAFPDRLLLGDDVVWSGDLGRGFSSHRITSPMTNSGATLFGPATDRPVRTMNIADCEITEGQISREWLMRDNLALVRQLGLDPMRAARTIAEHSDDVLRLWLGREYDRVRRHEPLYGLPIGVFTEDPHAGFARKVLTACWTSDEPERLHDHYAPYCVMHRAPVRIFSGRDRILRHYAAWRTVFPDADLTVDHVCSQPFGGGGSHVAARWSIAGKQQGRLQDQDATGRPVYLVGATHWRVLNQRIIAEWTVFDELAMLAQVLDRQA
jgi:predicted ester cyclase